MFITVEHWWPDCIDCIAIRMNVCARWGSLLRDELIFTFFVYSGRCEQIFGGAKSILSSGVLARTSLGTTRQNIETITVSTYANTSTTIAIIKALSWKLSSIYANGEKIQNIKNTLLCNPSASI